MHMCVRLSWRADDVEDRKQAVRCADSCDVKEGGRTYRIEMRVVKRVQSSISISQRKAFLSVLLQPCNKSHGWLVSAFLRQAAVLLPGY